MGDDVAELIKKELSSGPKTPGELRKLMERKNVSIRNYHYHLKQLIEKLKEVEEIPVEGPKGRLIKKYALKEEQIVSAGPRAKYVKPIEEIFEGSLAKVALELAAWIRYDPEDWRRDDVDVKRGEQCLTDYEMLVPEIRTTPLDPNRYIFEWSDYAKERLKIDHSTPRFFNLKTIYEAKWAAEAESAADGPVFMGVNEFEEERFKRWQSCVVVRRTSGHEFHVVHVEKNLADDWTSAIREEFDAERLDINASTGGALKRDMLLHLRKILEEHKLLIPGRYDPLIEDLLQFGYGESRGEYVLALTASVWISKNSEKSLST